MFVKLDLKFINKQKHAMIKLFRPLYASLVKQSEPAICGNMQWLPLTMQSRQST